MKKICCVNDLPGVGKVALSAMIPILSAKGIDVASLPTALVSNTLDFGKFDILDTTDYMKRTVSIWEELGFSFDCISTGFMVNPAQVDVVERLIDGQEDIPLVMVDPIMGDEGKLYNGMGEENVSIMRRLAGMADILVPNLTEACLLAGLPYPKDGLNMAGAIELIGGCQALGAKSVVITSIPAGDGWYVAGYDHTARSAFSIGFDMLDARFPGTGDVFSAALVGDVLNGSTLKEATGSAMRTVRALIECSMHKEERFLGTDIERFIAEGRL